MDFGSFKIPESYLLILSIALVIPAIDSVVRRGIHLPSPGRLRYPAAGQPADWTEISGSPAPAASEAPARPEPVNPAPHRGSRTPSLPMAGLVPLPKPNPRSITGREPQKKFYSGQN